MHIFFATLTALSLAFTAMALGVLTRRRKNACACRTAAAIMAKTARRTPSSLTILSNGCSGCSDTGGRGE